MKSIISYISLFIIISQPCYCSISDSYNYPKEFEKVLLSVTATNKRLDVSSSDDDSSTSDDIKNTNVPEKSLFILYADQIDLPANFYIETKTDGALLINHSDLPSEKDWTNITNRFKKKIYMERISTAIREDVIQNNPIEDNLYRRLERIDNTLENKLNGNFLLQIIIPGMLIITSTKNIELPKNYCLNANKIFITKLNPVACGTHVTTCNYLEYIDHSNNITVNDIKKLSIENKKSFIIKYTIINNGSTIINDDDNQPARTDQKKSLPLPFVKEEPDDNPKAKNDIQQPSIDQNTKNNIQTKVEDKSTKKYNRSNILIDFFSVLYQYFKLLLTKIIRFR